MTHSKDVSGASREIRSGLFGRLTETLGRMRAERCSRTILKDLASRHDYLLADIGVTRFDLEQALASADGEDATLTLIRARQNPLKDWRG